MRRGHGGMRRPRSAGVSLETAPEPHIPVSLSPPCHLPATTLGTVTPEASPVCHRGRGEAGGKRVPPPSAPCHGQCHAEGKGWLRPPPHGDIAEPAPGGAGGGEEGLGEAAAAPDALLKAVGMLLAINHPPHGLPPRWQQGLRGTGPSPRRCASEKRARNLWGGGFWGYWGDIWGGEGHRRGCRERGQEAGFRQRTGSPGGRLGTEERSQGGSKWQPQGFNLARGSCPK